jgi:hypothetical protein
MCSLVSSLEPLTPLLGRWRGRETLEPSPWMPGGTTDGAWSLSAGVGGTALIQDYEQRRDGEITFVAHGVIAGEAPGDAQLRSWWFDTFAHAPLEPAKATVDGRRLTVTKRTARGTSITTLWLDDDTTLNQTIELQLPGEAALAPLMRGRYDRIG